MSRGYVLILMQLVVSETIHRNISHESFILNTYSFTYLLVCSSNDLTHLVQKSRQQIQ